MLSLFTVPTASNVIASSSDYAGTFFTEFSPIIWVAVGLFAAAALVLFLIRAINSGVARLSGHKHHYKYGTEMDFRDSPGWKIHDPE